MSFDSFDLHPQILAGVKALGYSTPTPIQRRAIPPVLQGQDVLGLAQTGTGKTAAFVLPILQRLVKKTPGPHRGPRHRADARVERPDQSNLRNAGPPDAPAQPSDLRGCLHGPAGSRSPIRSRNHRRLSGSVARSHPPGDDPAFKPGGARARRGGPDAGHGVSSRYPGDHEARAGRAPDADVWGNHAGRHPEAGPGSPSHPCHGAGRSSRAGSYGRAGALPGRLSPQDRTPPSTAAAYGNGLCPDLHADQTPGPAFGRSDSKGRATRPHRFRGTYLRTSARRPSADSVTARTGSSLQPTLPPGASMFHGSPM